MKRTDSIHKTLAAICTLFFFFATNIIDLDEYHPLNDCSKLVVQQDNDNEIDESHASKVKITAAIDPSALYHPFQFFSHCLTGDSLIVIPVITLCHALRAPPTT
ncbi:MAG: hypothetical protein PHN75_04805 [Syntrophales bacterium]|nr:hypothetical protein [Syntrophales bacterium]